MRKPKFVNSSSFSPAVQREPDKSSVVNTGVEGSRVFRLGAEWGYVVATKTDNLKLTDEQKTRLLSFALEPEASSTPPNANDAKGDLLCDILRCPLPVAEHPPGATKGVPQGFRSVLGPSLGQLLSDPEIDIAVLRHIKEYAKALGRDARSDTDKDVFLAIYFAAIAAGLTFHSQRISWDCGICFSRQ